MTPMKTKSSPKADKFKYEVVSASGTPQFHTNSLEAAESEARHYDGGEVVELLPIPQAPCPMGGCQTLTNNGIRCYDHNA